VTIPAATRRVFIAHIVFRFDYGGLENGVVNLINGLPAERFDHAVIALTTASEFRNRIRRGNVVVHALAKRRGNDLRMYYRLWRLLRRLRPDIVHTRNFGTLDCQVIAWLAGVRLRVHGEHGWDVNDPNGTVRKYQVLRQLFDRRVTRWMTMSRDLQSWLQERCAIAPSRITQIYNGVDIDRFRPRSSTNDHAATAARRVVIGTVTRFEPIKDPCNLVRAFVAARRETLSLGIDLRLVMVGDGTLRSEAERIVAEANVATATEFLGGRDDVAALLPTFDLFVLGSLREGISNTILEAMAAGLPVIATATGGNLEIVEPGKTGELVPVQNPDAMRAAIVRYASDPDLRRRSGSTARAIAVERYSLQRMLRDYARFYEALPGGAAEAN
jgi:sugar transferase (PEP-CTERM/EpsH1 system associated)